MMNTVPTSTKYEAALLRLEQRGIPPAHIAMLRAHYSSGNRGLTAGELAKAAGYRNHTSVNLQYGTFAGRLAKELGTQVSPNLAILVTWDHEVRSTQGHLLFPLLPQVACALEALGWVDPIIQTELDEEFAKAEGELRLLLVRHRARETRLRSAKIADALARSSGGRLRCEVPGCEFDFEAVYGEVGRDYAQVHHLVPLKDLHRPRVNRLQDLAIVCANCHVMIHRGGENRSLKDLIKTTWISGPNSSAVPNGYHAVARLHRWASSRDVGKTVDRAGK